MKNERKCKIRIYGQVNGNCALLRALNSGDYERGWFNSFDVYFPSIKEARQAIREANRRFKSDEPKCTNLRMSKDAGQLYYDASQAVLLIN